MRQDNSFAQAKRHQIKLKLKLIYIRLWENTVVIEKLMGFISHTLMILYLSSNIIIKWDPVNWDTRLLWANLILQIPFYFLRINRHRFIGAISRFIWGMISREQRQKIHVDHDANCHVADNSNWSQRASKNSFCLKLYSN